MSYELSKSDAVSDLREREPVCVSVCVRWLNANVWASVDGYANIV